MIDLYGEKVLNPNVSDNAKFFADGLHPNNEGHALLANIIKEHLAVEETSEDEGPENAVASGISDKIETSSENIVEPKTETKRMTRKELFEELYRRTANMRKSERKAYILTEMKPYFKDENSAVIYVENNMERKTRNAISRRIRLHRKANLQEFNFFVTFTYSDELQTEDSFRKGLRTCLRHFVERKNWRYIGVWERSPEKKRLHFHGIFYSRRHDAGDIV